MSVYSSIVAENILGEKPNNFLKRFIGQVKSSMGFKSEFFIIIDSIVENDKSRYPLLDEQKDEFYKRLDSNISSLKENEINDVKVISALFAKNVWRSPLEYAISKNAPINVIMKLLEAGANPSSTACSIIASKINISNSSSSQNEYYEKVAELLSFSGAKWEKPFIGIDPILSVLDDGYKKFEHKNDNKVAIGQFVIEKMGAEKAFDIGVSISQKEENKYDYNIDLDKFITNVEKHRQKREGKLISGNNQNYQQSSEKNVEISIPENKRVYWKNR